MLDASIRYFRVLPFVAFVLLASCGTQPRGPAVPEDLGSAAVALNNPAIRSWDDDLNEAFLTEIIAASERELQRSRADDGTFAPMHFLAISGGGSDGAFGAGLLSGWSATGNRPEFKVVTGVSTGALTAPFAFLGPRYDEKLRRVYTTIVTNDIFRSRGVIAGFFNDALFDTAPLRRLMESLIDEEMMRDIASEYQRGRLLFIGTTNLDADRGVVWNIGTIAASGDPGALKLIHDVLMASAAIPAGFPPIMIDVEAEGKKYQEMHVDGGTKSQVFLYPPSLDVVSQFRRSGINRERHAYIIRNARFKPDWEEVPRRTLAVAARSITALIRTQGIGDLYQIYMISRRDNVDFNLAYIPDSFTERPNDHFDPVYMTKLFELGYRKAAAGFEWSKVPPGWVDNMDFEVPTIEVPHN
ncbi:MAG: patatin-like phospholipase family protein [Phycisphaerae bacterium]|nr:patatin-like phospholipase family protein [Phycisphaerae bacterium]